MEQMLLCVLLSLLHTVTVGAISETSHTVYHVAPPGFSAMGTWPSTTVFGSAIVCCAECTMRPNCTAVNYHEGSHLCELIEPGTTLLNLAGDTDRLFYYTDMTQINYKYNATANQSSMRNHDGILDYASYAIDGLYGSYMSPPGNGANCQHTMDGWNQWWIADFRMDFHIQGIAITNRLDCCLDRLRNLRLTVSKSLSGVDDDGNVCGRFPGPPNPLSLKTVVIGCTGVMTGRYVKILKQDGTGLLTLCEVDLIVVNV